ncbi:MAG: hypothetical protein HF978_08080 [Desulfobacteraceae bacterium]|nr:hypothetical protein [Desulfobacteraceae bacterium]MBC2755487.1 hypothetical protein [Desulfobacteraceae bacterium]
MKNKIHANINYGDIWLGLKDKEYNQKWALETTQDVISVLSSIPLNLISLKKLKRYNKFYSDKLQHDFNVIKQNNYETCLKYLNENCKTMNAFSKSNKLFSLTPSSFEHPLIEALNTWDYWRALNNWFCISNYEIFKDAEHLKINKIQHIIPRFKLAYTKIILNSHYEIIITGGPFLDEDSCDSDSLILSKLDMLQIKKDLEKLIFSIPDTPVWIPNLIWLYASARPVSYTQNNFELAAKSIERAINVRWVGNCRPPILEKSTCAFISRMAWSKEIEQILNNDKDISKKDNFKITIKQRDHLQKIKLLTENRWYGDIYLFTSNIGEWCITNKENLNEHNSNVEIKWLKRTYDLERRVETLRHEYLYGKILRLRDRIQRRIGVITGNTEPESGENDSFTEKYSDQYIAEEIGLLLRASAVIIDTYNFSDKSLYLNAIFVENQPKILEKLDLNEMKTAKDDFKKRKIYICYRIIDDKIPHFCRAYGRKWSHADPPGQEFQIPYKNIKKDIRSLLGVPLRIYGRIFGTVIIGGTCPYQFSQSDLRLLGWVSESLGYHIYRRVCFMHIQNMISKSLKENIKEKKKYHEMCKSLSSIFLAYSSTFWQPRKDWPSRFIPIGWHNRDDLNDLMIAKEDQIYVDLDDKSSTVVHAINNLKPGFLFHCFELSNLYSDIGKEKWAKGHPHRKWLIDKGIKWVSVIFIQNEKTNNSPKKSGHPYLCLYYKDVEKSTPLSSYWEPTVKFVAEQVALLIESIRSIADKEKLNARYYNHEIKQAVDSIFRQTKKITSRMKFILEKENLQEDLYLKDIKSYTKCLRTLVKTSQEKAELSKEEAIATHGNPILLIAFREKKTIRQDIVNIREMFSLSLEHAGEKAEKKSVTFNYDKVNDYHINIPNDTLTRILRNLTDNSIKYSIENSEIKAETEIKEFEFIFRLINISEKLDPKEIYAVCDEEFRGANSKDIEGEGLGLFLVKGICDMYSIALSPCVTEKTYRKNNYHEFIVELSFKK